MASHRGGSIRGFSAFLALVPATFFPVCLASRVALAKNVSIDWKPVDLASRYELEVTLDGSTVIRQEEGADETRWAGDLKPGNYEYRIRTLDRLKRWGEWSSPMQLIVLPDPPSTHPITPRAFYGKTGSAEISWDPVPGISKYRVTIVGAADGGPAVTQTVEDHHLIVKGLEPGSYRCQVRGLVPVKPLTGTAPASNPLSDEVETRASLPQDFTMRRLPLASPVPKFPIGPSVPHQGRVRFAWTPIEGAESYQVHLLRSSGQELIFTSRSPSLTVRLATPGRYSWKVRALASEIQGPQSAASFTLSREPQPGFGTGYVAVSTMIAPYNYGVVNPLQGYSVSTQAMSSSLQLSGGYFLSDRWAVGGTVESTFINLAGVNVATQSAAAFFQRAIPLGETHSTWTLLPRIGVEERQYIEVYPPVQGAAGGSTMNIGINSLTAAGPQLGLDLRKRLTPRLSLDGNVSYFLPVLLSGAPVSGASIVGVDAYRNLTLGLQGLYWLDDGWALGAGGILDLRSISYETPGQSSPDQIREDSTCLFGSLMYTFGR